MKRKTEYRRDLQHSWMILSGGDVPDENAYAVRMITENRIDGLLPCRTAGIDGELQFYYDISSRHSLAAALETKPAGRGFLEQLLASLAKVMEQLSEYLLDPDGLLLDPMYLYCDPGHSEIRYCWYPEKEQCFAEQAKLLGSALLPQLDQTDRAGVVLGYRFYQYCELEELTLKTLRGMLRQKPMLPDDYPVTKDEAEQSALPVSFFDEPEAEEPSGGSLRQRVKAWFTGKRGEREVRELYREAVGSDPAGPVSAEILPENPAEILPEVPAKASADTSADAGTMYLSPDMLVTRKMKNWSLQIKEKSGKERRVLLTEDVYLVGKRGSGATLQLDSSAVSRLHARMWKNEGKWMVRDMNSRNGTVVGHGTDKEGVLLQPEDAVVLEAGDRIRFADVTCIVMAEI